MKKQQSESCNFRTKSSTLHRQEKQCCSSWKERKQSATFFHWKQAWKSDFCIRKRDRRGGEGESMSTPEGNTGKMPPWEYPIHTHRYLLSIKCNKCCVFLPSSSKAILVSEQQIFFSNIPIHYWILMCKRLNYWKHSARENASILG